MVRTDALMLAILSSCGIKNSDFTWKHQKFLTWKRLKALNFIPWKHCTLTFCEYMRSNTLVLYVSFVDLKFFDISTWSDDAWKMITIMSLMFYQTSSLAVECQSCFQDNRPIRYTNRLTSSTISVRSDHYPEKTAVMDSVYLSDQIIMQSLIRWNEWPILKRRSEQYPFGSTRRFDMYHPYSLCLHILMQILNQNITEWDVLSLYCKILLFWSIKISKKMNVDDTWKVTW